MHKRGTKKEGACMEGARAGGRGAGGEGEGGGGMSPSQSNEAIGDGSVGQPGWHKGKACMLCSTTASAPHLLALGIGNQDAFASFEAMIWQLCRREWRFAASCASLAHTCRAVSKLLLLAHATSLACHWA